MRLLILSIFMLACALFPVTQTRAQFCTVTCPANITLPSDPNLCGRVVQYPPAQTSGLCFPVSYNVPSGSFFPVGTTTVVASTSGVSCSFTVTIVDTTRPAISSISANPSTLWPPNHKMRDVRINYTATDNCPGPIGCRLVVTSDEPLNSTGDGNTEIDWIVRDDRNVQLRAEREGNGDGRVYTIAIMCTDRAGNTNTQNAIVTVAHDQGKSNVEQGRELNEQAIARGLSVTVLQNPSRSHFTLKMDGYSSEKVNIKIFDLSGRVMESLNNINAQPTLRVGNNLKAGVYILELRQGKAISKLKLVKN